MKHLEISTPDNIQNSTKANNIDNANDMISLRLYIFNTQMANIMETLIQPQKKTKFESKIEQKFFTKTLTKFPIPAKYQEIVQQISGTA